MKDDERIARELVKIKELRNIYPEDVNLIKRQELFEKKLGLDTDKIKSRNDKDLKLMLKSLSILKDGSLSASKRLDAVSAALERYLEIYFNDVSIDTIKSWVEEDTTSKEEETKVATQEPVVAEVLSQEETQVENETLEQEVTIQEEVVQQ